MWVFSDDKNGKIWNVIDVLCYRDYILINLGIYYKEEIFLL